MVRTRSEDGATASSPVQEPAGLISPVVDFVLLFVVVFVVAFMLAHTL